MDEAMSSVEARLLTSAIAEVKADIGEMRTSLHGMQRAMEALVRIDEQQINIRSSIGRSFDEIKDERIKREAEIADERKSRMALDERVQRLEIDAPSFKELRRWVIGGVLAGMGMLAAALLKVIVFDPMGAAYVVRPLAPQTSTQQQAPSSTTEKDKAK